MPFIKPQKKNNDTQRYLFSQLEDLDFVNVQVESFQGEMAKVLPSVHVVSKFELTCYIHFQTNSLGKGISPPPPLLWVKRYLY